MCTRLGLIGIALFAVAGCGNNNALLNCPTGLYACSNQCVDLASDFNNCGECGHICIGGTVCIQGQCTGQCANQLTMCGVACVDTRSDHAHCGDCMTTCKGDEVCLAGKCAVSCGEALTGCSGACVDLGSDSDNCGTCGHACPHGHACAGGTCQVTCESPLTACGDQCVDQRFDPNNCGGCNMSCPGGKNIARFCNSGACGTSGCEPGFYDCNGQGADGCEVDGRTDPKNCGGCYIFCPQQGQNAQMIGCVGAKCVATSCDMGFGDCNMDANDGCESQLDSDAANCGACGNNCAPPHMIATCTNSKCAIQGCEPGWTDCDGDKKNGCEANLNSDGKNCGKCGNVCPMQTPNCGKGVCGTLFTFMGVQNDVKIADLTGWAQCWIDNYGNTSALGGGNGVLDQCSGGSLLIGCRKMGADTLQVAAMGDRADVIFDTKMGNVTHDANGVSWYYNNSYSWGFAQGGDPVQRNSCDVNFAKNPDQRMCWHTGNNSLDPGYRCGSQTSFAGDYERLVFQAN